MYDNIMDAVSNINEIIHGKYVLKEQSEKRITELLNANNIEVEKRREVTIFARELYYEAKQTNAISSAYTWVKKKVEISKPVKNFVDLVDLYVLGYMNSNLEIPKTHDKLKLEAFEAGKAQARSDRALLSAERSASLMTHGIR